MTTILFYFFIILALAGSSYYGWRSAKSAKNRQETQEQKRLRSILLFVNVLLFAGFLSLVITILNDAFILTGHEGLLQQGLRMLLGSGVTVKSTSTSLTLFTATIDFLRMSVNIGFLLCLRAFLKMLSWFVGQRICSFLGPLSIMVSLHLGQATRVIVSLISVIC